MAQRIRVLLAETDAGVVKAMTGGLRGKGIEVLAANDAAHAMSLARKERPDAVIMSATLAGGGLAALRRLRSNVFTTHIPVVAIAHVTAQAKQMIEAGAQESMAAPIDYDKLDAAIRRNLLQDLDFTQAPKEVIEAPERMQDLHDAGLLDTPPERSFDLLTSLAATLCGAPTALVTLVDKDRQFFKSQVGLGEPWVGQRQTRLSHSFCQWVVTGREPVVIEDATLHPVLKSNLAIRDLGVIAYAGIPINGRRGQAIGSFCAIDSKRREWSEEELSTLHDLARIAQAYAALGEARQALASAASSSASANLQTSVHVAGNAVLGAVHILKRHGKRLADAQCSALMEIIEEQASHLVQAVKS